MRALLAAALVLASLPARADHAADAHAHFERGLRLFSARGYDEAGRAFEACYKLDPQRECLFAWAQAERLSGDCPSAIVLYRRYLDTYPSPRGAETARRHMTSCERALTTRPEGAPPSTEAPAENQAKLPADTIAARPAPTPTRPWHRDPAAAVLVGLGLAGVATGAVLFPVSASTAAQAPTDTFADYASKVELAGRERTAAIVSIGLGAGALAAGVIRWAVLGARHER